MAGSVPWIPCGGRRPGRPGPRRRSAQRAGRAPGAVLPRAEPRRRSPGQPAPLRARPRSPVVASPRPARVQPGMRTEPRRARSSSRALTGARARRRATSPGPPGDDRPPSMEAARPTMATERVQATAPETAPGPGNRMRESGPAPGRPGNDDGQAVQWTRPQPQNHHDRTSPSTSLRLRYSRTYQPHRRPASRQSAKPRTWLVARRRLHGHRRT